MSSTFATSLFASAESNSGSGIVSFGILLLIPLAMYFLMIRPQRKRAREQQELQAAISVGQEVVTTSGIFGTITGEDGDTRFWLEIDDDVQIRIARAAISSVVTDDDEADDESSSTDTPSTTSAED